MKMSKSEKVSKLSWQQKRATYSLIYAQIFRMLGVARGKWCTNGKSQSRFDFEK